ncbi:MAG TPA: MFS transporter [Sphingobium sp.]|uniref:MFS transporter n=1 Tax=Sphingobium sp. TaxID=1912891 RepID=UPI002ED4E322
MGANEAVLVPDAIPLGPSSPAYPRLSHAWYVATLLTVGYALAILDRASIALLIQPLQASLHISDTQFGYLQGMAFSLIYSVLGLPVGMLADKRHRVGILLGGLILWSLATMGCGLARSFGELFAARTLVGVGEAVLVPVATSLIADFFPPAIRPKAYGLFVSGSAAGTGAAFMLSGFFLASAGYLVAHIPIFHGMEHWQVVFVLCGAPGLALALLISLTMREPARQETVKAEAKGFPLAEIGALLKRHPLAFGGLIGGVVMNLTCVYAIIGWFPALFIRVHGWSAPQTGWTLGVAMLPISLTAALGSGWVITALTRLGLRDAPLWIMTASAASMAVFATTASLAASAGVALTFYLLNTCCINWTLSGFYPAIVQITPSHLRGQMVAIQSLASALIAMTAGNAAVGYLSQYAFPGTTGVGWALATVFLVCGGASMALLIGCRGAFHRAAAELEANAAKN